MHAPWDMVVTVVCAVLASTGFWSWISSRSSKRDKISSMIKALDDKISLIESSLQRAQTDDMRWKILAFDSELRKEEGHTQEEFIEIISVIDSYEAYCATHPNYKNNKARVAISNIKKNFAKRQELRDYL